MSTHSLLLLSPGNVNSTHRQMVAPQGSTEVPAYFMWTLNANVKDLVFPCNSSLTQYGDGLLVCSVHFNKSLTPTPPPRVTRYLGTYYNHASHNSGHDLKRKSYPQHTFIPSFISSLPKTKMQLQWSAPDMG